MKFDSEAFTQKIEIDNCYNMDCLDGMHLMKEQGMKAHMLLTDIPYGEVNRKDNRLRNMNKQTADICDFDLNEFAKIVQTLDYGDKIWLYGSLAKKAYVGENGKTRNTLFCSLMDLRIISKADGSQQKTVESVVEENDDSGFDDL